MQCPICKKETKVLDSRICADGYSVRRRRECLKCSFRFSTYEEIELLDVTVVKRDGRREPYSREKLIKGMERSLEKRPITKENFKKIITHIERGIQLLRKNEVTSEQVGEIVMKELKKIDPVAYIRFASVYRSFQDAATFERELKRLFKTKTKSRQKKKQ